MHTVLLPLAWLHTHYFPTVIQGTASCDIIKACPFVSCLKLPSTPKFWKTCSDCLQSGDWRLWSVFLYYSELVKMSLIVAALRTLSPKSFTVFVFLGQPEKPGKLCTIICGEPCRCQIEVTWKNIVVIECNLWSQGKLFICGWIWQMGLTSLDVLLFFKSVRKSGYGFLLCVWFRVF